MIVSIGVSRSFIAFRSDRYQRDGYRYVAGTRIFLPYIETPDSSHHFQDPLPETKARHSTHNGDQQVFAQFADYNRCNGSHQVCVIERYMKKGLAVRIEYRGYDNGGQDNRRDIPKGIPHPAGNIDSAGQGQQPIANGKGDQSHAGD